MLHNGSHDHGWKCSTPSLPSFLLPPHCNRNNNNDSAMSMPPPHHHHTLRLPATPCNKNGTMRLGWWWAMPPSHDDKVPQAEATKQAIHLRTVLLILARSVEWRNACHYPLKGHRQGKKIMRWMGWVYLAWGTRCTGLQGKDQENQWLWPLYTTTVFVHVYTRSLIRDKRDYCYWSSKA